MDAYIPLGEGLTTFLVVGWDCNQAVEKCLRNPTPTAACEVKFSTEEVRGRQSLVWKQSRALRINVKLIGYFSRFALSCTSDPPERYSVVELQAPKWHENYESYGLPP